MISCAQREVARSLTIPQFQAQGIEPKVFLSPCTPAGPRQNNIVSLEALEYALDDDCLFIEDDIDIAPDFAGRLAEAENVTYFYLNDNPDRLFRTYPSEQAQAILKGEPLSPGIYKVLSTSFLFGSQCVYLPKDFLPLVRNMLLRHREQPMDGALVKTFRKYRTPVYVCLPHPVQHRHDRTGRSADNKVKRSMSFR